MAKKTIRVHTPFTFTNEDNTSQRFEAGEHVVDDKVADHWFVTAHSEITGKAKATADNKEFQAQIDSLTAQLEDKDKTIGEQQASISEKDATIEDLTAQLEALKAPAGDKDAKEQKPTDGK